MSYTAPVGSAVELPFLLGGYAKPEWDGAVLNFDTTPVSAASGSITSVIDLSGNASGVVVQEVIGVGAAVLFVASGGGVIGCSGEASAEILSANGTGSASPAPTNVSTTFAEGGAAIALSAQGQGAVGYSADAAGSIELFGLGSGSCFAQVIGNGAVYLLYATSEGFVSRESDDFDTLFVHTNWPRIEVRA